MTLAGLVRVSMKGQDLARQHDALDPICVKVFEEKVSGRLPVDERPGLRAALGYLRDGDMLTMQEVDRLGRNLLEGMIVLTELLERGIAVKVLEGISAEEHTERSLILARREEGESIRVIARVLDVSVGSVHSVLAKESAKVGANS